MKCILLLSCLLFVFCNSQSVTKPIWPGVFDVPFGLSVPAAVTQGNPIVNSSSHFYYNWDQYQATLITYAENCIPVFPGSSKAPCNITFVPSGAYFTSPTIGTCLWLPGIGSIPPAFLAQFNYTGYQTIESDFYGVPHFTYYWDAGTFQYWTDTQSGQDIKFIDGGIIVWNFAPTFSFTQWPASIFQVPKNAPPCKFPSKSLDRSHNLFNVISQNAVDRV
eukprot:TRINITY_DN1045_c0_g1_i1.p1 TRINITY_DN1045_c0_g1~~TRINITY_DN1045_c0_g1_i1.p1  ORF type:complete len:227 (-),score=40.90 TRINITY_DN1045_c0_g1_i1:99-758(-)